MIAEDYFQTLFVQPDGSYSPIFRRSNLTVPAPVINPGAGPWTFAETDTPGSLPSGRAANLLFLDSFDHYPPGYVFQAGTPNPSALTQFAGGTFAQTTYFVKTTYVTIAGESLGSNEGSLVVSANNLLRIASPAQDALGIVIGYNVYVSTTTQLETQQNITPIAIGTSWSEPSSGLTSTGKTVPLIDTSTQGGLNQKWTSTSTFGGEGTPGVTIVAGRRSPQNPLSSAVSFAGGVVSTISKTIGVQTDIYVGFAIKFGKFGDSQTRTFFGVGDEAHGVNGIGAQGILGIVINNDGTISVATALGGSFVIATSSIAPFLTLGIWYYLEIEIHFAPKISSSSSTVGVKVNGVFVIPNTTTWDWQRGTANGIASTGHLTQFGFDNNGGFYSFLVDDLYVDGSGFHGDVAIFPIWPNGVGTHQDWANSGGSGNNFTYYGITHDKPGADEETTFIDSSTVGQIETDNFEDIPLTATVIGAQWVFQVRKDEDGARNISPFVRQNGVDYLAGVTLPVTDNYLYQLAIYNTDPTGVAWTPLTINNDEYGLELVG